ncbi:hypothetical protein AJ79_06263 [Helicocarpus griseus UAMH5409]|uniref:RNA 3'-terminal phosphate cyclase domain-containing protein n=1 Tax=Helicocarpus griseus UAMH5409 TaxID=1447875 RepID=A0A2B7XFY2_9EURO|nr:hypothetical protein AJ79_06263 [Helicocarpus griseus UAMH5409]
MLHLDGSTLEGGGQLVRNALALSALTGRPVTISNIRGGRKEPRGLRRSHTAAIQFLAEVCGGRIVGATVGSSEITFYPRGIEDALTNDLMGEDESLSLQRKLRLHPLPSASPIKSEYNIRLATPGSIFLIFQALYPYLLYAGTSLDSNGGIKSTSSLRRRIKLNITGGTNVSSSPSYDYVSQVLIPNFANLGLPRLSVKLNSRGWSYGAVQLGSVSFDIEPLGSSDSKEISDGDSSAKDTKQPKVNRQRRTADKVPSGTKSQTKVSHEIPLQFPRIDLEGLDPGFITQVDITVLAPDTTLQQAIATSPSKSGRQQTGKRKNQRRQGKKGSEKCPYKPAPLYEPQSADSEPSMSEDEDVYGTAELQSIRVFLETAAVKSINKALKPKLKDIGKASVKEAVTVKIHTTEATSDRTHIYLLLVAHTSTGFRLGRDILYSEYLSRRHKKNHRDSNSEKDMQALLRGMAHECVADLISEFPVAKNDGHADHLPGSKAKGCLDTYMRDQVVVFQALGQLDEQETGESQEPVSSIPPEEEGLSLHTLTAKWVCEQILGVKV